MQTTTDRQQAIEWAKQLLDRDHFCIMDVETTGLHAEDEICSIGAIDCQGNVIFNRLVRPMVLIHPEAQKIHYISNEAVANESTFDVVFMDFLKAIGNRDLVIYNAEHELRFIRQSLKSLGVRIAFANSERRGCKIFTNGGSIHCAMLWYARFMGEWNDKHGDYKWQKLPNADHSSLGDCRATLGIIRQMSVAEP